MKFFEELPVPPQVAGVVLEYLIGVFFYLYNSGILSTTVELFYLKDAILFLQGLLLCVDVCVCTFPFYGKYTLQYIYI